MTTYAPDITFEMDAHEDTECGKQGIKHKMRRFNCYETRCINSKCRFKI